MPFRAQCVFCGHEMRAPDHASGASVCCPKCSSFFTLAPMGKARGSVFSRGPQVLHQAPALAAVSSTLPPPIPDPKEICEPEPALTTGPLTIEQPASAFEAVRPKRRWFDPLGLAALLSGAAALLCTSVAALCGLVIPLGVAGLLLGAAGLLLVGVLGRVRLLFPVTGTAVAGLVLFTALLSPRLLGPVFLASRARDPIDPSAIRVVPLPGTLLNTPAMDPDWVDASQAALQQGPINVRVVSVRIRRVTATPGLQIADRRLPIDRRPATGNLPLAGSERGGDYQFIRLRIQQVVAASAFAAKQTQRESARFDKARPRLADNTGKVYELRQFVQVAAAGSGDLPPARAGSGDSRPAQAGAARSGDPRRVAHPESAKGIGAQATPFAGSGRATPAPRDPRPPHAVFPVTVQDLVLVFDAPDTHPEYLRLEVPAEAWTQKGAFRFTIPASMIHDERARSAGRRW